MSLKTALKRFFTWDARQPPRNHEEARDREVFDRATGNGQFGSGDSSGQRLNR